MKPHIGTKQMDKTLLGYYKGIHGLYVSYSRPNWLTSRYLTVTRMMLNEESNHIDIYIEALKKVVRSRRIVINILNKIRSKNSPIIKTRFGDLTINWSIRRYIDEHENILEYYFKTYNQLLYNGEEYCKKEFLEKLLTIVPYDSIFLNKVMKDLEDKQAVDKKLLTIAYKLKSTPRKIVIN